VATVSSLDLYGDVVDVLINGKKTDSVNDTAFQRAVSSIWLDPEPPNDELKAGILGS
jgi:hypothetical protein